MLTAASPKEVVAGIHRCLEQMKETLNPQDTEVESCDAETESSEKFQRWRLTMAGGKYSVFTCRAPEPGEKPGITHAEAERLFMDVRYGHAIAAHVVDFEPWRVE